MLTDPMQTVRVMALPLPLGEAAYTHFTEHGNHLLMSGHNLGPGPFEKKTLIHLQSSIMRFHKCKDKMCYHVSWIAISGV